MFSVCGGCGGGNGGGLVALVAASVVLKGTYFGLRLKALGLNACAAERLGVDPRFCLALEDSYAGVRSASSAGMTTIMVPDLIQPDEETRGRALHIGQSLDDVLALLQG